MSFQQTRTKIYKKKEFEIACAHKEPVLLTYVNSTGCHNMLQGDRELRTLFLYTLVRTLRSCAK